MFSCQSCGYSGNADVNAAKNILRQGVSWLDVEGSDVAPPCEASSLEAAV